MNEIEQLQIKAQAFLNENLPAVIFGAVGCTVQWGTELNIEEICGMVIKHIFKLIDENDDFAKRINMTQWYELVLAYYAYEKKKFANQKEPIE